MRKMLLSVAALCLVGGLIGGFFAYRDITTLYVGESLSPLETAFQGHQHGSLVRSDYGDVSTLSDGGGTEGTDDYPFVRDESCGEGRALVVFFDNGNYAGQIQDGNGCTAGGAGRDYGRNFSGHTTCGGVTGNGQLFACGVRSGHGS